MWKREGEDVLGSKVKYNWKGDCHKDPRVHQETRGQEELLEGSDLAYSLFLGAYVNKISKNLAPSTEFEIRPLRAIMVEPIWRWEDEREYRIGMIGHTIHKPQPSHPKKLSFSLRNMDDSIAHITTERAPRGVYASWLKYSQAWNAQGQIFKHTTTRASIKA
jgi:hypothetical protein